MFSDYSGLNSVSEQHSLHSISSDNLLQLMECKHVGHQGVETRIYIHLVKSVSNVNNYRMETVAAFNALGPKQQRFPTEATTILVILPEGRCGTQN